MKWILIAVYFPVFGDTFIEDKHTFTNKEMCMEVATLSNERYSSQKYYCKEM